MLLLSTMQAVIGPGCPKNLTVFFLVIMRAGGGAAVQSNASERLNKSCPSSCRALQALKTVASIGLLYSQVLNLHAGYARSSVPSRSIDMSTWLLRV